MRYKNKIYYDCCGEFLRTLDEKEMKQVNDLNEMGCRLNSSFVCDKCAIKNEKRLKDTNQKETEVKE